MAKISYLFHRRDDEIELELDADLHQIDQILHFVVGGHAHHDHFVVAHCRFIEYRLLELVERQFFFVQEITSVLCNRNRNVVFVRGFVA